MQRTTPATVLADQDQSDPPDIETMRDTVGHLVGPDDEPGILPPSAAEITTLSAALRGHLEVLLPEVERVVGPRPKNVAEYCALACVGEARRKLGITPAAALDPLVAHARRLARSLRALCDHYESLTAESVRRG